MSKVDGIYGEDAAAIAGVSTNKTAYYVYLEKTDQLPNGIKNSEADKCKKENEDRIAMEFCIRTEKKIRRINKIYVHSEYEFMVAEVERKVVGENALLLCKDISVPNIDKFKNKEFPRSYIVEAQHYLAVTGFDVCYFSICINQKEIVIKQVNRNELLIRKLIASERRFWENRIQDIK